MNLRILIWSSLRNSSSLAALSVLVLLLSVGRAQATTSITSVTVSVSRDSGGLATAPYTISFLLTKSANVTVTINNSLGNPVRTVLSNAFRADQTVSTNTVTWDGLTAQGSPAPVGAYTASVSAVDPTDQTSAAPAAVTIPVESLNGDVIDFKSIFEKAAFVYPNPVRNGQGTFQYEPVRDGAVVTLKIYTIDGTLVRSETFNNLSTGVTGTFVWDTTNQSGRKVGRGLYYYVIREQDSSGSPLQVVKKMAVIP